MSENFENDVSSKRLGVFIGVAVVVIIAVTAGAILLIRLFGGGVSSDEVKSDIAESDVEISIIDRADVDTVVSEFVNGAANFGFNTEGISSGNINDVQYLVSHSPNGVKNLFTSRDSAYANVRDYMFKGGSRYFDSNVTGSWSNEFDTQFTSSFRLDKVSVATNDKGAYLIVDGKRRLTAYADVVFSSTQTIRNKTADDSSWDGTFDVLEKGFPDNSARVTVVQDDNLDWKIYAINDLNNEFLTAAWANPDANAFLDTQRDFTRVGSIKSDVVDDVDNINEDIDASDSDNVNEDE